MQLGLAFVLGGLCALVVCLLLLLWRLPYVRRDALEEFREALAREATVTAREKLFRERDAFESALDMTRTELKEREDRCRVREDALDRRIDGIEARERQLATREAELKAAEASLEARRTEVEHALGRHLRELERVSGMRREEAEHLLLEQVERRCQAEAEEVRARAELTLQEDLRGRAREALLVAAQRVARAVAHEALVTVVPLADDELKAVLVGREGRNARAFEAATGVDLLIDDTPGAVVLSAFDPVRRELGRRALVRLLEGGRVDPERIEQVVSETRQDMEEATQELGRTTAEAAGVEALHPRLLAVLGRLEFVGDEPPGSLRQRAIDAALLAGSLAGELGLEPAVARRCGLLHPIGRALAHEQEGGGAATAAAEFARRCGEPEEVVEALAAAVGAPLGEDAQVSTPYAAVTAIAAAVAAHRPGADEPQASLAVRRRAELEALALEHAGVERAYAVQAGRELRVLVDPARVSEKSALRLAREVARRIEEGSPGPGRVTVTVLRETRVQEVAG